MKNKFLMILVIAFSLFQQKAFAQLPAASNNSNPIWYYIQVKGLDDKRENLVFTIEGEKVFGRALGSSVAENQLWRFEKDGNAYTIISKSGETKKMDVTYDATKSIRCLSISSNPITKFEFDSNKGENLGNYYTIKVTVPPTGGDAAALYAHQANAVGSRNYDIMLVDTEYYDGDNSAFSFVGYDEMNLEHSTSNKTVWYTISSSKDGIAGKCLTDVSVIEDSPIKIEVKDPEKGNDNQLWKLVKKGTRTNFINKNTGNVIQTSSTVAEPNIMYNYTQLTQLESESKGWKLTSLGLGQYSILGSEEDNITRYITATIENSDPETYDENNLLFSAFAWKFNKSIDTSLPPVQEINDIRVYSVNKKIVVEGAENFITRNIQGVTVNGKMELPMGIYLVTVNGKTIKVFVN